MNYRVRTSEDRGRAEFGWLSSRHTFSFGGYHDPEHMGFGPLRVINEDHVTGGGGFGEHGHANMEILSYVVTGHLAHRDSLGNASSLGHGDIQLMSAGSGIRHSEFNGSDHAGLHFLQVWLRPQSSGTQPRYAESKFENSPGLRLIVSPTGRLGSLVADCDVDVFRLQLETGASDTLSPRGASVWVQLISGGLTLTPRPGAPAITLSAGDGVAITGAGATALAATADVEALVFDIAQAA